MLFETVFCLNSSFLSPFCNDNFCYISEAYFYQTLKMAVYMGSLVEVSKIAWGYSTIILLLSELILFGNNNNVMIHQVKNLF